jgi:flagellar hook protein FlgE
MSRSLISALSGLRSHQGWIDVIGNNLANSNTPAYKSSRALFASLLSRTLKEGTPASGNLGGTNPSQVGLGTQLSYVDRDQSQGALNVTGRTFDLAMLGRGYFTLSDGVRPLYTRVGSFGLDASNNMVDLRTGYRVLDQNGQAFQVNTAAVFPPSATAQIDFGGNLPAKISGPLAEQMTTASALMEGTPAQLAGGAAGPFAIPDGETWTLEVTVNGGAPQELALAGGPAAWTAADIAASLSALDHLHAEVGPGGTLLLTSDTNGQNSTIKVTPGSPGSDLAQLLGLSTALVKGTESAASANSDLNSLTRNQVPYQVGDGIELSGSDADGSPVQATFLYGVDGTTVGDFVAFLSAQYQGATASFQESTGSIQLTADETGEALLSVVLSDNGTGSTNWAQLAFTTTTVGTGPDTVTASMEVFDSAGSSHVITFDFVRQDDGSWNAEASMPSSSGQVTSGTISNIRFNENGSLLSPPSGTITVQFNGMASQSLQLDLGTIGGFGGLTQFGSQTSLVAKDQDGYPAGELSSMSVTGTGDVQGFYTNGQTAMLGSFGVSVFTNEAGLAEASDNYWVETSNSGQRFLGAAMQSGGGEVIGGALEESNVDTAEEFVRLIQAQRGFQANARLITVQDAMLEEVVNVV